MSIRAGLFALTACVIMACTPRSEPGVLRIAVATNFQLAMTDLEREFEALNGYDVQVSYGSSGKLYAQIRAGAPFDIFLSADQYRARSLSEHTSHLPFTYAYGKLALLAKDHRRDDTPLQVLKSGAYRKLAMANPDLAPYGGAAMQVLTALGLQDSTSDKIVTGENVGHAYTLIATGNAELGFVAMSHIRNQSLSYWDVPDRLYTPIAQDAVQISDTKAASAFVNYLRSETAKNIIRANTYGVP